MLPLPSCLISLSTRVINAGKSALNEDQARCEVLVIKKKPGGTPTPTSSQVPVTRRRSSLPNGEGFDLLGSLVSEMTFIYPLWQRPFEMRLECRGLRARTRHSGLSGLPTAQRKGCAQRYTFNLLSFSERCTSCAKENLKPSAVCRAVGPLRPPQTTFEVSDRKKTNFYLLLFPVLGCQTLELL